MMIIIFYREHLVSETSNTSAGETYGGTRLRTPKQSVVSDHWNYVAVRVVTKYWLG